MKNMRKQIFLDWEKKMRDELDPSFFKGIIVKVENLLLAWLVSLLAAFFFMSVWSYEEGPDLINTILYLYLVSLILVFGWIYKFNFHKVVKSYLWKYRDHVVATYRVAVIERIIAVEEGVEKLRRTKENSSVIEEVAKMEEAYNNKEETEITPVVMYEKIKKFDKLFKEVVTSNWSNHEKAEEILQKVRNMYLTGTS